MNPAESRSARLFTSEIIATGVSERRRMAAKTDPLFAAVGKEVKIQGIELSKLGLGSMPPVKGLLVILDEHMVGDNFQ